MRILIGFATSEGHTGKLARFMAERLRADGHQVTLADLSQNSAPDPAGFDRAILAASLHVGRYQKAFRVYARRHHAALGAMDATFLSVSLAAAGTEPADRAGLDACVQRMTSETGWTPARVHHAAGAIPFSAYGWLVKFVIWFIVRRHGMRVRMSEDYDLTDYEGLGRWVEEFSGAGSE